MNVPLDKKNSHVGNCDVGPKLLSHRPAIYNQATSTLDRKITILFSGYLKYEKQSDVEDSRFGFLEMKILNVKKLSNSGIYLISTDVAEFTWGKDGKSQINLVVPNGHHHQGQSDQADIEFGDYPMGHAINYFAGTQDSTLRQMRLPIVSLYVHTINIVESKSRSCGCFGALADALREASQEMKNSQKAKASAPPYQPRKNKRTIKFTKSPS